MRRAAKLSAGLRRCRSRHTASASSAIPDRIAARCRSPKVDYSRLDAALPRLLTDESKWLPDSPYWWQIAYREARLDADARRRIADYASILFERLGCHAGAGRRAAPRPRHPDRR